MYRIFLYVTTQPEVPTLIHVMHLMVLLRPSHSGGKHADRRARKRTAVTKERRWTIAYSREGRRMLGTCPTHLNSQSSKTFYRGQCGRNVSLNALRAAVACHKCILSFAGHTVLYRAKLSLTVLAADFLIDYKNSLVFSLSKRPRRPFLPRLYPFPDT